MHFMQSYIRKVHVKNWYIVSFFIFLYSFKKWVKYKLKTFSHVYKCFLKSIQQTNHFTNVKQKSMYKHQKFLSAFLCLSETIGLGGT